MIGVEVSAGRGLLLSMRMKSWSGMEGSRMIERVEDWDLTEEAQGLEGDTKEVHFGVRIGEF